MKKGEIRMEHEIEEEASKGRTSPGVNMPRCGQAKYLLIGGHQAICHIDRLA
jgi:hypothetical protein